MKVKKYLSNGFRLIADSDYRFQFFSGHGGYRYMSDEAYLKRKYRIVFGKELDLEHPKTYFEKLQWLKLYYRNPLFTQLVDKYSVKQYVAEKIGAEYIIPTLGVWDRFEDIEFDKLPNQFVLKCTHDSGGLVICRDKDKLDKEAAKKKIERCLKKNFYWVCREWPYKDVKPRIIAEQYLEDRKTNELRDYKFLTFGGETKIMYIASERQKPGEDVKFDFFDLDFHHLDIKNVHDNAEIIPEKPNTFETMVRLANALAEGIPHVRVDFYEVNGKIYFGEMTFSHMGGFAPFTPSKWDDILGSWLNLPEKTV